MPAPAIALFRDSFGDAPRVAASAPGRVNLIGAHTDYNGGPVLPIAVGARTTVAVGPADEGWLEAVSTRDRVVVRARWREQLPDGWSAYVGGVLRELWAAEALPAGGGVRLAAASDIVPGVGLGASSALTVAAAKAIATLAGANLTGRQLAGVAFRAEQDHVGVRCSVMDQTIAALAKPGQALLLECASLEAQYVPFKGQLLLVDTGVPAAATDAHVKERRAECDDAVKRLKVELPELVWLSSWPAEWLVRLKRALKEPVRSRAVHVVGETARARFGAQLLQHGRLKQFGALLFESHESCRRLYACSTPELDTVVAAAKRAGALGARLTGAGWGGAAIVLLKRGAGSGERASGAIRRAFLRAHGREPGISEVAASGGVRPERIASQ